MGDRAAGRRGAVSGGVVDLILNANLPKPDSVSNTVDNAAAETRKDLRGLQRDTNHAPPERADGGRRATRQQADRAR